MGYHGTWFTYDSASVRPYRISKFLHSRPRPRQRPSWYGGEALDPTFASATRWTPNKGLCWLPCLYFSFHIGCVLGCHSRVRADVDAPAWVFDSLVPASVLVPALRCSSMAVLCCFACLRVLPSAVVLSIAARWFRLAPNGPAGSIAIHAGSASGLATVSPSGSSVTPFAVFSQLVETLRSGWQ